MKRRRIILSCVAISSLTGCTGTGEQVFGDGEPDHVFGIGDIEVVINGEPVDLSADRFQAEYADDHAIEFHLHEFDDHWYMEGDRRVTVAEALDLLPAFSFRMEDGEDVLSIDDETYDARDSEVSILVKVNDETVDPGEYTLEDGDNIYVEVSTA